MLHALSFLSLVLVLGCGGNDGRASLCATQDPRPEECDEECDPQAAQDTCPTGFHCASNGTCNAECTSDGGECGDGYFCTSDGRCLPDGACVGLQCDIVECAAMSMPVTTLSGTIYAPNGTLPLSGISVYVPNGDPGPLTEGALCQRCGEMPGFPLSEGVTDEAGQFQLANVPSGEDIPLVIVSGKWRRQITIPSVTACADNALPAANTRLPKNASEGDLPKIAISTGDADALECLVRKLGIDDSEISTAGQPGRIHLYSNFDSGGQGASDFESGFAGGNGDFADSQTDLWDSVDHLKAYDIVILSCEGEQHPASKPQSSMDALEAYADLGGRVFASHWHNIWIGGNKDNSSHGIPDWQMVGDFNFGGNPSPDNLTATIDEASNPKGQAFATWMLNVSGSTMRGLVPVTDARTTCDSVDLTKGERWVYLDPDTAMGESSVMNFQFTTPQDATLDQRCGKVVFSDMHVSADSDSDPGTPYPGDCATDGLTPQEKALAFMFFDLASCISTPIE